MQNFNDNARRRSAQWLGLVVSSLLAWIWLGRANTHSVFFAVMGLMTIGAMNSAMAEYRMRRYAAARLAKYRANPSTHA